jgi:hypothetical protein
MMARCLRTTLPTLFNRMATAKINFLDSFDDNRAIAILKTASMQ